MRTVVLILLLSTQFVFGQRSKLEKQLANSGIPKLPESEFYYSEGHLEKARSYNALLNQQLALMQKRIPRSFSPVSVALLSEPDMRSIKELRKEPYPTWLNQKALLAEPDGVRRFGGHTIMVAADTEGDFKDGMHQLKEKILQLDSMGLAQSLGGFDKLIELSFDLILFHEIGHYLMDQYGIFDQPDLAWSNEFFANLFAYACMRETNAQYAKVWELIGQALLSEYLQHHQSLSQLNAQCKLGSEARTVMQSLLFFKAASVYEKDHHILEKLVADERLKRGNDYATQMAILDDHVAGFSKIEQLVFD